MYLMYILTLTYILYTCLKVRLYKKWQTSESAVPNDTLNYLLDRNYKQHNKKNYVMVYLCN